MTGTSWKRKVTTAIVTAAMAASMLPMSAFAEGALVLDSTATDATPTAGPGYSLTVGGLENGDTAKYYKIIEQDVDTVDSSGNVTKVGTQQWKLTSAVDADGDGIVDGTKGDATFTTAKVIPGGLDGVEGSDDDETPVNGLFIDDLVIDSFDTTDDSGNETNPSVVTSDTRQLTAAMANAIAAAIANNASANPIDTLTATNKQVTVANAPAGMYMFVAEPGADNIATVYKPVFVSADYYNTISRPEDGTHEITLVGDPATAPEVATDYLGNDGTFKRSNLDVDKKSGVYKNDGTSDDTKHDIGVGDVVDFTITTNIPTYSANYTSPVFKLTDHLTKGLELTDDEITVTVEGYTAETCKKGTDYKVTKNAANDGFTVEFLNDKDNNPTTKDGFLYTVLGSPKVTITYKAKVTSDAASVNQMDNTVKLNFSNKLDDEDGEGELQDKTRHYTFNIDADIFGRETIPGEGEGGDSGNDNTRTSEVRKVAIKADGTIQEWQTTNTLPGDTTTSDYDWLQGAKFELKQLQRYVDKDDGATKPDALDLVDVAAAEQLIKFKNNIKDASGDAYVTSDAKGYIAMKGLDAGVYVLREIGAPLGYSFDPSISYKITITPEYGKEGASSTDQSDENEILSGYTVEVEKLQNGASLNPAQKTTSHYTVKTQGTDPNKTPISFLNETFIDKTTAAGSETVDGTIKDTKETIISLDEKAETTLIVNKRLGLLPATGGSGIIFYLVVGGTIAGTAALLIEKDRKKRSMA